MVRYLSAVALLACASVASAQFSDAGFREGNVGGTPDINEYQRDDGVAENAIGLTAGGDFAWIMRYTSQVANPLITGVRVAFGTPLALNGTAATAYVWSDPNNDGSPADAVLLGQAAGVVSGANAATPINTPTFVAFNTPDVLIVPGQNFFVGVKVTHLAGHFPAAIDQTAPLPGAGFTWGTFGAAGSFNPNALGTGQNLTDFFTLSANGLHGDWLVRADAAIPEPASLGLLAVAGVLGLRRRH